MATILYRGREVRIIDRDSDPTAGVWIVVHDEPDNGRIVDPSELVEIPDVLGKIAHGTLGLDTLADRGRDALDFHDLSVGAIREALQRAYDAGREDAARAAGRRPCGVCPIPPAHAVDHGCTCGRTADQVNADAVAFARMHD